MDLVHVMHRDHLFNFRTDTHVDALLIPAMITLALYPLMSNETARRAIRVWDVPMFVVMELFLLTTRVPCFFTLQAIVLPLLMLPILTGNLTRSGCSRCTRYA